MYNKTCHVTAIPLRSIAAGEISPSTISLRRYNSGTTGDPRT